MTTVRTVGHGTLSAEEFASLLDGANVDCMVDVRSFPGSRYNPQFGREEMERWVPMAGIATSGCGTGRPPPTNSWIKARSATQ